MIEGEDYKRRICAILTEWDKAEEDIKLAEQVCHKVVWPSIKELRYAGGRVIDALHAINRAAPDVEINNFFQDAEFDCHRARHDAIDAATSTIAVHLEAAANKLGYDPILKAFPQFPLLREMLSSVRERIKISRRDRANREAIYSVIEGKDLHEIVMLYDKFKANEDIMKSLALNQRRVVVISIVLGVIGILVGVIGLLFAA